MDFLSQIGITPEKIVQIIMLVILGLVLIVATQNEMQD